MLATTFCIIAVFVPVAVMKGIIGRFFFQFGLTVSFAVAVSMLVSFTLTPMMAVAHPAPGRTTTGPNLFVRGIGARCWARSTTATGGCWAWRCATASITIGAGGRVAGRLGRAWSCGCKAEFLPPEDRAQFEVNVELPTGTSLEATKKYVEAVAQDLRKNGPGVPGTFVTVGGGAQGQVNIGQVQVLLTPRTKRAVPPGRRHGLGAQPLQGRQGRAVLGQRRSARSAATAASSSSPSSSTSAAGTWPSSRRPPQAHDGRAEEGPGHRRPGPQLPQRQARAVVRHRSRPRGRAGRAGGGHRHHACGRWWPATR